MISHVVIRQGRRLQQHPCGHEEECCLKPPVEIAYALVKQKAGSYRVRITTGNTAPIIVGVFPSKHEAQAWLGVERVTMPDQSTSMPAPAKLDRARKWRAKAEEVRTAAESMRNEAGRRTLLRLAHDYEALAEFWEKAARQHGERDRNAG